MRLFLRYFGAAIGLPLALGSTMQGQSAVVGRGRQVFSVVNYGAKNDGSAFATQAFRAAIQAAKTAGGGTVYVPPGRYISGPIELFSNMTFEVDAGATVAFPVAAIPFEKTRYLGVEALAPMALVGGRNVENVTITGRGTLTTGDYDAWGRAYGPPPVIPDKSENANGPHWDHLLKALEAGHAVAEAEYRAAAPELRPSFVYFANAKNVLVENIRIVGAPMFVVHLLYTENATVRNVMIEAYPGACQRDRGGFEQFREDFRRLYRYGR